MIRYFFCFFVLWGLQPALGQDQEKPERPEYLEVTATAGLSSFRDVGVSPILYNGFLFMGGIRYTYEGTRWQHSAEFDGGVGFYEVTRFAVYESNTINFAYGGYSRRQFWEADNLNMRYHGGVRLHGFTNVRSNPSLLNASSGVESINTLFLHNSLAWDLRFRKTDLSKAGARPSRHELAFELNLPLVTASWLPDYPYITDFSDGEPNSTKSHEFYWGGLRLQSRLTYRYFLPNGNALRFTYWWDYARTPDGFNQLDFINHALQFGLVMRLN